MTVLLYEDNLIWSSRLRRTLAAEGHEVVSPNDLKHVDVAIVDLSSDRNRAAVPDLTRQGIHVIGHAGHKEKDLLELGRQAGCQTVATNSQITHKLPDLIRAVHSAEGS